MEQMRHIVIEKLREEDRKDKDSRTIKNPSTLNTVKTYTIHPEMISVDDIKSSRVWKKKLPHKGIDGDVTIIYMKSKDQSKPLSILINESFESFTRRCNAIQLGTDEKKLEQMEENTEEVNT